jgi:hypothetical protein
MILSANGAGYYPRCAVGALDPENPRTDEFTGQTLQLGQISDDGEAHALLDNAASL